jgi:prepilin-type N-terminal cleavage/methylation domain-containing protein
MSRVLFDCYFQEGEVMSLMEGKARGFTLVEVMVSLLIFLVTSMGLLPLLITNMQVNHGNSLNAQAQHLAGEVMAELQVIEYPLLALASGDSLRIGDIEVQQQVEEDTPQPNQSRITVTAHWQQRGSSHRYRLQTIRTAP